ncbi:MAG: NAD(P)H-binding protein [Rhodospirillaceae bacterium]|jgi:uncharacterized protein YbjT (DUF2867 family)|nr:NAD(P)H-binding protein [Rhodospirillaceae bacterium]
MRRIITVAFAYLIWSTPLLAADGGVLVFGGSGQLGSEVVKDLVAAGEDVTVMVRPTSSRTRLEGLDVGYVVGDMLSDADMERILTKTAYRAIIDTSGAPVMGGDQTFYEKSQRVVSKWAAAGNVGQVILHGATGAGDSSALIMFENVPEPQRVAIGSKSIAEDILKESGVPYTIIRHLSLMSMENKESGYARLTTNQMAIGPVTRDALARLTMECLDNSACMNMTFHAIDDDVELKGRFTSIWDRYRTFIKPYVFEARAAAGQDR